MWLSALAIAGLGCSDYDLHKKNDALPGDTDLEEERPPQCGEGPEAYTPEADDTCFEERLLEPTTFEPVVEWQWSTNSLVPDYHNIMTTPVVGNLTDDNGDGRIDDDDVPDIVFPAFSKATGYTDTGVLMAISGADGSELWAWDAGAPWGCSGVALADLDGSGKPSVIVNTSGGVTRLTNEGEAVWTAGSSSGFAFPSVGDLEGDGKAEIVVANEVFDADGNLLFTLGSNSRTTFIADLDQDGLSEVVNANAVYDHTGALLYTTGAAGGYTALADFDLDGNVEIVVVPVDGTAYAFSPGVGIVWEAKLTDTGGGPPTVADFDGDGLPEVGIASEEFYWVLDSDGTALWSQPVSDYSSRQTGSSVFDFEGDGAAEVVYADEHTLWVFDGATGAVELAWEQHASGTLFEYPLVVDVDNDGATEIVLASNNYHNEGTTGITVLGNELDDWLPTRPVWNQHAYFANNINDDLTVPVSPGASWVDHNSFRANTGSGLPSEVLWQSDLTVEADLCSIECLDSGSVELWVSVANRGLKNGPETTVSIFDGAGNELASEALSEMEPTAQRWLGPFEVSIDAWTDGDLMVRLDQQNDCKPENGSLLIPIPEC